MIVIWGFVRLWLPLVQCRQYRPVWGTLTSLGCRLVAVGDVKQTGNGGQGGLLLFHGG